MLSRTSNQFGPISTSGKARAAYRYYRWSVTKIRDYTQDLPVWSIGLLQIAEIQLFFAGTSIGITGATCTNPGGSNPPGEEPDKANDGTVTTKWLDASGNGIVGMIDTGLTPSRILVIDFGAGTRKVIDAFRFATANDSDGRDPVQWTFEGSNDNSNWTMLNMQSTDASVTTSRQTFTQLFYLQV